MRKIWTFTLLTVVVAVTVVVAREYRKSLLNDVGRANAAVVTLSDREYDALVARLFSRLEYDHQAWHLDTQEAVEAVATLAEKGIRETATTQYALGVRLSGERKRDAAERAFRRAIELDPSWSWPHVALGIALYDGGRKDEARAAFAKAAELEPRSSRPHSDLSVLLRLDGRLEEAEKEAHVALELAPDRLDTLNAYANVLKELGQVDRAREYYNRAIVSDPSQPTPYYNLACLSLSQKKPDDALALLDKAFALDASFSVFAQTDPDLKPLRRDARFQRLIARYKPKLGKKAAATGKNG